MSSEGLQCKCRHLCLVAPQGHITITNYLLNYYPGLDIERRNCHGLTALMKAAMQGRVECVRALMMAGEGEPHQKLHIHYFFLSIIPSKVKWHDFPSLNLLYFTIPEFCSN